MKAESGTCTGKAWCGTQRVGNTSNALSVELSRLRREHLWKHLMKQDSVGAAGFCNWF